jgi:hypothetical protein
MGSTMWTHLEKGRDNCKYVLLFFFHAFHPCIVKFKCLGVNSKLPKLGFLHTIQLLGSWHTILFYK